MRPGKGIREHNLKGTSCFMLHAGGMRRGKGIREYNPMSGSWRLSNSGRKTSGNSVFPSAGVEGKKASHQETIRAGVQDRHAGL